MKKEEMSALKCQYEKEEMEYLELKNKLSELNIP